VRNIFLQVHILSTAGDALTSYAVAQLCVPNKLQTVNVSAFFVLEKFSSKDEIKHLKMK
jgi:hypothetical protein